MIGQRVKGIQSLLITIQGALLVALFWLWMAGFLLLTTEGGAGNFDVFSNSYLIYCVVLLGGFWLDALLRGERKMELFESSLITKFRLTFRQTAVSLFALFMLLVLTKDRFLSRVFLASFLPGLYFMLLWTNHKMPQFLARKFFGGSRIERTLMIGKPEKCDRMKPWFERKEKFGIRCVGVLCEGNATETPQGLPILGLPQDIDRILKEKDITQVIMIDSPVEHQEMRKLIRPIQAHGSRLHILSSTADIIGHPIVIEKDEEFHFIALHEEPLENPANRTMKRLLDLCISIPVVVFILPVLTLIVWVLQCMQSRGPIFYKQTRARIQNDIFEILKFRTMSPDNTEMAKQATNGDDRIFPAGRWLRRMSIDEIPQFVNVLRGEMSVVGPRPHLIEHNRQFAEALQNYNSRAFVKPGITGLAQVRGFRGETKTMEDIKQRLESDLFYLENWSFFLDLVIIARTAWQVCFPPRTAY